MKRNAGTGLKRTLVKYRTQIVFTALAYVFSAVLMRGDTFSYAIFGYAAIFWLYTFVELSAKIRRPSDPETLAVLKVSTENFVDWAITNMQGELVVSGWGNRTIELASTGNRIDRELKVKFSEFVYCAEVTSGNGDAFVSLTVGDDDEFAQTVACGRTGDPEVLYTCLNTGYGTKHWLVPGCFQGIPS